MVHSSFLSKPETMNWWFRAEDSLDLIFFVFLYIKKEPKKNLKMTQQFFKWSCRPSTCDVGFKFPRPHTTSSQQRMETNSGVVVNQFYRFVLYVFLFKKYMF